MTPQSGQLDRRLVHGLRAAPRRRPAVLRSRLQRTRCTTNPLGVKGCGEAGAIAAFPAIANAIADALAPLGVSGFRRPRHPGRTSGGLWPERAKIRHGLQFRPFRDEHRRLRRGLGRQGTSGPAATRGRRRQDTCPCVAPLAPARRRCRRRPACSARSTVSPPCCAARRATSAIPLDMADVPDFNRRVYEVARTVPPGATITYGEIAARLGDPQDARAVGEAMGRNPFAIVVPCHRVVAANGKMGGFSAYGGVATKQRMLIIEGAPEAAAADAVRQHDLGRGFISPYPEPDCAFVRGSGLEPRITGRRAAINCGPRISEVALEADIRRHDKSDANDPKRTFNKVGPTPIDRQPSGWKTGVSNDERGRQ